GTISTIFRRAFDSVVVAQRCDVRKVPVQLGGIHAVPDDEGGGRVEAHEIERRTAGRLVRWLGHQRADVDGGRTARLQQVDQVFQRQTRVDDVLDQQHPLAGDRGGQVAGDLDAPGGNGGVAVAA